MQVVQVNEVEAIEIVEGMSLAEKLDHLFGQRTAIESRMSGFEQSPWDDLDFLVYFHCLLDILSEPHATVPILYAADSVGVLLRLVDDLEKQDVDSMHHVRPEVREELVRRRAAKVILASPPPEPVLA